MHEGFVSPMDMKVEHQYGLHHENDFGSGRMDELGNEQSSPPVTSSPHEYSTFGFQAPTDSIFNRPFQSSFSSPPSLHPLNTSEATLWPSQITNPSEHSSPPISLPILRSTEAMPQKTPTSTSPSQASPAARPATTLSTSRRTLSDDDRRRMCKYHEENPSVKQTEIGGTSFAHSRNTADTNVMLKQCLVSREGNEAPPQAPA